MKKRLASVGAAVVVQQLGSDISSGLSPAEAGRRLIEYGANELRAASRLSPWTIFFGQLEMY